MKITRISGDKYESIAAILLGEKIPFSIYDVDGNTIITANKAINQTELKVLAMTWPNVSIPESPIKSMLEKRLGPSI
jgi:hypothetical protein